MTAVFFKFDNRRPMVVGFGLEDLADVGFGEGFAGDVSGTAVHGDKVGVGFDGFGVGDFAEESPEDGGDFLVAAFHGFEEVIVDLLADSHLKIKIDF